MNSTFSWVFWPEHQRLFQLLPDPQGMRFVGGSVRNSLLGLPVDDFDLATIYPPEQAMSFYRQAGMTVVPTGLAHGTFTLVLHGRPYEITTLRRDVHTDGRWACVAYTDSWQQDAQRRDFTMNALYVDHQGCLYDDVGGQKDLRDKRLRFIGDPTQRIQEDYLRILRFFRFWIYYAKCVDTDSVQACITLAPFLKQLSKERITKEMLKILNAKMPFDVLTFMLQAKIMPWVLGCDPHPQALAALALFESQTHHTLEDMVRLSCITPKLPDRLCLSRAQTRRFKESHAPWVEDQWLLDLYQSSPQTMSDRLAVHLCHAIAQRIPSQKETAVSSTLSLADPQSPSLKTPLSHPMSPRAEKTYSGKPTKEMPDLDDLFILWSQRQRELGKDWPPFPLAGQDMLALGLSGAAIKHGLVLVQKWWIAEYFPDRSACLAYAKLALGTPCQSDIGAQSDARADAGPGSGARPESKL
jgi:poly(A) polymerase